MAQKAIQVSPDALSKEDAAELRRRDFVTLVDKVNSEKPSRADIQALADCYRAVPAVYKEVIGMGTAVKVHMIDKAVSGLANQMALHCELDDMRSELGFDDASGLERLLIDAVVLSWLRLQHTEYWRSEADTWQAREYWDKQLSAAQRRFLRACESLAKVRKLLSRPSTVARSIKILNALS
ncbi:MAG: hypothetical protein H6641_18370 [Caldilineaceae bacterium]|nr:hypothetical protein [Caldilineaceae bacterium]